MSEESADRTKGVDSARRVLQILLQFSETRPTATIDEIAEQHGISLPSAYRYIALLRELHLVEERSRGVYMLSSQVLRLTAAAEISLDVVRAAEPTVNRLVDTYGETVLVLRQVNNAAVCVLSAGPPQTLSLSFRPGHVMPLHRGAAAKVLLAAMTKGRRDTYLDRLEPGMDADFREGYVRELGVIAQSGISTSNSEVDDGIWAVAAPIAVAGIVVATLSIAGPSFRIDDDKREVLIAACVEAAREISSRTESPSE